MHKLESSHSNQNLFLKNHSFAEVPYVVYSTARFGGVVRVGRNDF